MTLPDERLRALKETKAFLYRLMDPKVTPKVPSAIREEARHLLKHYPDDLTLDMLPHHAEKYFSNDGWRK
jgi:hypothetical protein